MEPTVKLNNFVAASSQPASGKQPLKKAVTDQNNRFSSSAKPRQAKKDEDSSAYSSEQQDDYEDDFESLSKSQVGLSLNKYKKPQMLDTGDSYSNEQFESMAESKTLSGEDRGVACFMCKQMIPKSQALSH